MGGQGIGRAEEQSGSWIGRGREWWEVVRNTVGQEVWRKTRGGRKDVGNESVGE